MNMNVIKRYRLFFALLFLFCAVSLSYAQPPGQAERDLQNQIFLQNTLHQQQIYQKNMSRRVPPPPPPGAPGNFGAYAHPYYGPGPYYAPPGPAVPGYAPAPGCVAVVP